MPLSSEREWCTQVRYASVINTGNVTDDCFSSLSPRCSLTVLQLYIHVHETAKCETVATSGLGNRLLKTCWFVDDEGLSLHTITRWLPCFFFFLFWTMDRRTRLVPIATTIHGPSALGLANARKSSFHSGLRCSITNRGVLAISTSVRVRPIFFFLILDAIVLATYQVVFAGFVFNQFLSDFKNKHTAAKVL